MVRCRLSMWHVCASKVKDCWKNKTNRSFNESLIRLKCECDDLNYQIWEMIENGVPSVLLQMIVKSLIRFER